MSRMDHWREFGMPRPKRHLNWSNIIGAALIVCVVGYLTYHVVLYKHLQAEECQSSEIMTR